MIHVEIPLILLPTMMAIVALGPAIPIIFHPECTLPTPTITEQSKFPIEHDPSNILAPDTACRKTTYKTQWTQTTIITPTMVTINQSILMPFTTKFKPVMLHSVLSLPASYPSCGLWKLTCTNGTHWANSSFDGLNTGESATTDDAPVTHTGGTHQHPALTTLSHWSAPGHATDDDDHIDDDDNDIDNDNDT